MNEAKTAHPIPLPLQNAYDPEHFRAQGHQMIDMLADYLKSLATAPANTSVLPWYPPSENMQSFPPEFPGPPGENFGTFFKRILERSIHIHHPHYIGHQVSAPLPLAALCELFAALLNNSMAIYEMGPASTAMERSVIHFLAGRLGLGPGADGVLSSGGSIGNLTALLAARRFHAGFDAWNEGDHGGPPLCVLASEQSHYCIARSIQIMGWGKDGVIPVPVDSNFRMLPSALPGAYQEAARLGRRVVAVVASAGSTATGAFDPLEAIADFCQSKHLWFHVDGAHGASAILSPKHRKQLQGIERADSVVIDAHKMLLMPSLITAILFKNGQESHELFAQKAEYLFLDESRRFDIGLRTLECTKRMMGLKLYASLRLLGPDFFSDYITRAFDLGAHFAELLQSSGEFELPVFPEANIVCFRYRPKEFKGNESELDSLQERIRLSLRNSGAFYVVQTKLKGKVYLRTTLINPMSTENDLIELIEAIQSAGQT